MHCKSRHGGANGRASASKQVRSRTDVIDLRPDPRQPYRGKRGSRPQIGRRVLIARRYLEQFALGEKPQCPRARRSSSAREREKQQSKTARRLNQGKKPAEEPCLRRLKPTWSEHSEM